MKELKNLTVYNSIIIILVFVSIFLRFEREVFAPVFHSDQQRYLVTSQLLLDGKGVSLSYTDTTDISKSITKSYAAASEGYTYLIAPFLYITSSNYWAIVIPNILAILLLLFTWWKMYLLLSEKKRKKLLITFLIFFGFSNTPYVYYGSTDLVALAFLWYSIYLSFKAILLKNRSLFIASGIMIFFALYLRFAYIPLVFIVPISLIFMAIKLNEKRFFKSVIYYFVPLVVFLILSSLIKTHDVNYVADMGNDINSTKRLYFENLKYFNYSFPIQSFFDERLFYSIFSKLGITTVGDVIKFILSLSLFIVLIIKSIRYFIKEKLNSPGVSFLIISSWLLILVTVFELSFFSLNKPPERSDAVAYFTYIAEHRYFAPVYNSIIFLALFFSFFKQDKILRLAIYSFSLAALLYFPVTRYAEIKSDPNYFTVGENKIWSAGFGDVEMGTKVNDLIDSSFVDGVRPVFLCHDRSSFSVEVMGAEYGGSIANKNLNKLKTSKDLYLLINIASKDLYNCKQNFISYVKEKKISPVLENEKNKIYRVKIKNNKD